MKRALGATWSRSKYICVTGVSEAKSSYEVKDLSNPTTIKETEFV